MKSILVIGGGLVGAASALRLQAAGVQTTLIDPGDKRLLSVTLGPDELVLLVHPSHPFAGRETVPMAEFADETVIAHSDPSPARDQVLRQAEVRHAPINIQIALPSLEGIKRAVEKKMGVALLPRRCAVAEIERKHLVAVKIPEVRYPRQLRLLFRKGELSHAAQAFLEAESYAGPSLIIAYSHCIAHGYDMAQGVAQQKLAVDSGVWPLYRFDPRRVAKGEPPLRLDYGPPKTKVVDYLRNEGRFRMVERADPARYAAFVAESQAVRAAA